MTEYAPSLKRIQSFRNFCASFKISIKYTQVYEVLPISLVLDKLIIYFFFHGTIYEWVVWEMNEYLKSNLNLLKSYSIFGKESYSTVFFIKIYKISFHYFCYKLLTRFFTVLYTKYFYKWLTLIFERPNTFAIPCRRNLRMMLRSLFLRGDVTGGKRKQKERNYITRAQISWDSPWDWISRWVHEERYIECNNI